MPNVEMIYEVKLPEALAKSLEQKRYTTYPLKPLETAIDLGNVRIMSVQSTIQADSLHSPKTFEEKTLAGQHPQYAELTWQLMKEVSAVYDLVCHLQYQTGVRPDASMRDKQMYNQLQTAHSAGLYTLFSSDALIHQDPARLSTADRALQLMEQQMVQNCHPASFVYAINLPIIFNQQMEQMQQQLGQHRVPSIDDVVTVAANTANTLNSALGLPDTIHTNGLRQALFENYNQTKWPTDSMHTCAAVESFQRYANKIPQDAFLPALRNFTDMAQKAEMPLGKDGVIRQVLYSIANDAKRPDIADQLHEILDGDSPAKTEQEEVL